MSECRKKTLAIDTSVLIGLIDSKDTWHTRSVSIRSAIEQMGVELIYFDPVINESLGLLGRRLAEQNRRSQFKTLLTQLHTIVPSSAITWISNRGEQVYQEIITLIEGSGGDLNYHDALIAITCRDSGLSAIASYDQDFDSVPWLKRVSSANEIFQL